MNLLWLIFFIVLSPNSYISVIMNQQSIHVSTKLLSAPSYPLSLCVCVHVGEGKRNSQVITQIKDEVKEKI